MSNEESPLAPFFKGSSTLDASHPTHIAVMSRYDKADIPKDYEFTYVNDSIVRESQTDIYQILDEYIKTFTQDEGRVKNLYLCSRSPGTGKTTTSVAVLNEYIRRRFLYLASKGKYVPETLGLFLDVNEWQTEWNLASMAKDDEAMGKITQEVRKYSEVSMLVIDDVGVRSATEAFRALIHSIINSRITNQLPTIFTSNVPLEELSTIFDDRLYDRIRDKCLELTFTGESERGM